MKASSLGLGASDEDFPRRFVQLPFGEKKHTLAFGGDDGSISILDGDTVKNARRFSEMVRAVAPSNDGKRVAVGFGDGSTTVFVYDTLQGDFHPFLTAFGESNSEDAMFSLMGNMNEDEMSFPGPRFQTPVRCLVFDPRPSYMLACASEDSGFCIVDATNSSTLSKKRFLAEQSASEHNETGVRGLAYHMNDKQVLLASLDLQGRLCVWDVTGDDPELEYELLHKDGHKCVIKIDQGVINDSEPADQTCFPVFCKTFLGLPGSNDLQLRSVNAIDKQLFIPSVDGDGHVDTIVSIALSEDGAYAVTAGRDKRIVVWKTETDGALGGCFYRCHAEMDAICTHILWADSVVLFAFENGTFAFSTVGEVVPSLQKQNLGTVENAVSPTVSTADTTSRSASSKNDSRQEKRNKISKASTPRYDSDDGDTNFDDDEMQPRKGAASFVDDEADEFDDDNQSPGLADSADVLDQADERGDEVSEDDADFDTAYPSTNQNMLLPEPQPAFSPSSTPLDLPRRIMCWNHIGTITLLRGDEGVIRNTIAIDFIDSGFRRPLTFTDTLDFMVGSLGEDGAIFATDLADNPEEALDEDVDEVVHGLNMSDKTKASLKKSQRHRMRKRKEGFKSTGSNVYFHRFETFGTFSNKDWVVALPDGELVVGCATGEGWAACITNRRFLRLFTSGGNQGPIIWLKGDPVTVVGRSRFLAVFYHETLPMPDGTQQLGYTLYDAITAEEIKAGSLACISARSSLTWAGFSKEGSLMVLDSDGMLSMLVVFVTNGDSSEKQFSWSWSPVLDTVGLRKSFEDMFWPVSVQEGKLICVPLKGGKMHPDAARRPVTSALNLRMPFAAGADRSTQLEELSVRANLALNQKKFLVTELASYGYDVGDSEDEYNRLCAQVDKVTLRLFMAAIEAGKLERALDLVERLHLEKSFEISMMVADKMNYRTLSDKIEIVKDRRFAARDEEYDIDDAGELFPDSQDDLITEIQTPHKLERNIIPDSHSILRTKRPIEEVDQDDVPVKFTNKNPFAKKRIESPARPSLSPTKGSSPHVGISRMSSFSARSREMKKVGKTLL